VRFSRRAGSRADGSRRLREAPLQRAPPTSALEPPGVFWNLLEWSLLDVPGTSWNFLEPLGASWMDPPGQIFLEVLEELCWIQYLGRLRER
jgi:hypothetical protein